MMPLPELADAIACDELKQFSAADAFEKRDAIKKIIAAHLRTQPLLNTGCQHFGREISGLLKF